MTPAGDESTCDAQNMLLVVCLPRFARSGARALAECPVSDSPPALCSHKPNQTKPPDAPGADESTLDVESMYVIVHPPH